MNYDKEEREYALKIAKEMLGQGLMTKRQAVNELIGLEFFDEANEILDSIEEEQRKIRNANILGLVKSSLSLLFFLGIIISIVYFCRTDEAIIALVCYFTGCWFYENKNKILKIYGNGK